MFANLYRFEFKEIYALLDTFKLHLETAERTPDAFKEEDEEYVTNLIQSIHRIIPELEKYCIKAKKNDEKERQARNSEFSSVRPELSEETANLDSDDDDDDDINPELEKHFVTTKNDNEKEQQARKTEFTPDRPDLSEKVSNLDSDDDEN